MSVDADPGAIAKAAGWVAGIAAAVISWLFHRVIRDHDHKISELEGSIDELGGKIEKKVDQVEHDRQRDHIVEIFKRLGSIDVSNAKTEAQMSRFSADIEKMDEKLDRLLERRQTR